MTNQATGTFQVKMIPQEMDASSIGRLLLDKLYEGDLRGAGMGQMLAERTVVSGSAGYVAMERVTGTLHGREGSFVLQHSGTMNRGIPELLVTVVPDSGTNELSGLAGTLKIIVAEGKHSYEFDYTISPQPA